MNRIYYEHLIRRLERIDGWTRATAAFISSAGVTAAIKFLEPPTGATVAITLGVVAAALNVTSLFNIPDRIKTAAAIHPQYVALLARAEQLYASAAGRVTHDQVTPLLKELETIERLEAEKIRYPNEKLLALARAGCRKEIGAPLEAPAPLVAA